jgi:hypothetical protein
MRQWFRQLRQTAQGRIAYRPLAPGELDFERWILLGSLVFLGVCWISLHAGLPWPRCPIRHFLGIPCASCGATRCALACLHGSFTNAFRLNPLMFGLYSVLGIFDLYAVWTLIPCTKRVRLSRLPIKIKRILAATFFAAIAVNWGYLLMTYRR